ncbi:unnamed protein product [Dibothriocephalus latus]|uniref:Reverse transcriptase domain-containing protein n=1 Tax=Dibothriocephalus latus TaxID=60516 RepID=A0A3P7NQV1_DIBLA|nr:unnamed protein product [Dibothriocephalus latus]
MDRSPSRHFQDEDLPSTTQETPSEKGTANIVIIIVKFRCKIFTRVLLSHASNHVEQGLLPESQCGFRLHRGTNNLIIVARQL